MRLLLDEMHSPTVAQALCGHGHEVHAVASDPLLRGMSDAELLHHCARVNLAIVTENVRDYAVLNSQWMTDDTPHADVIYTDRNRFNRHTAAYPANLITALNHFLQHPPVSGDNWVWWLQPSP